MNAKDKDELVRELIAIGLAIFVTALVGLAVVGLAAISKDEISPREEYKVLP